MKALFVLLFMIAYGFVQWYWILAWILTFLVDELEAPARYFNARARRKIYWLKPGQIPLSKTPHSNV